MTPPPWPVDAAGQPLPRREDGTPDFASVSWPTDAHGFVRPIGPDGRPVPEPARSSSRMRLPAFVIAIGVVGAAVVAFLLPVHDNFSVRCPGQGAVGAIQADANGYAAPDLSVQSVPGFDGSSANAQILANEQAVITSKVRACHDSGETRLLIAGGILVAAVIGSRFVPDVGQRER